MLNRVFAIVKKEFLITLRDPRMRVVLFLPPLIQLLIFGYAVNLDVENNRIAWLDWDKTMASRKLLSVFEGSRYFEITAYLNDFSSIAQSLDHGEVEAVIQIPRGFGKELKRGKTGRLQVLVDGTNSNTASIVSNYISRAIAGYSVQLMLEQQKKQTVSRVTSPAQTPVSPAVPSVELKERVWFNPDLESRAYFVPGVVVNIIALVTITLTSMAIVREKEIGTMEQLMVTPIRPVELMLGKTLPFAAIGVVQVGLVTGAALLVFRVPLVGSAGLLLVCSILFLLTTLGAGLLISTLSNTQQQAMIGSFFFFLPTFMLSGFAFPIQNMPEIIQYLTYLNPIRYFMEIVRGIFLKGTGIEIIWNQMAALTIIGIVLIGFSAARFHKRLD